MVVLPLAPVLLGPTSRVRVASTVSPSFFLSAPEMAPRIVWCCQPVAAAICSTVAPSGRLSISIIWACLLPARGVGFAVGSPAAGAVSVAFLPLPLAGLALARFAAPSASLEGAGASAALSASADVGAVSAPAGASSPSGSTPIAAMPSLVTTTTSAPRSARIVLALNVSVMLSPRLVPVMTAIMLLPFFFFFVSLDRNPICGRPPGIDKSGGRRVAQDRDGKRGRRQRSDRDYCAEARVRMALRFTAPELLGASRPSPAQRTSRRRALALPGQPRRAQRGRVELIAVRVRCAAERALD
jgi:hypothetical protein